MSIYYPPSHTQEDLGNSRSVIHVFLSEIQYWGLGWIITGGSVRNQFWFHRRFFVIRTIRNSAYYPDRRGTVNRLQTGVHGVSMTRLKHSNNNVMSKRT
jgi:hypothetical protein